MFTRKLIAACLGLFLLAPIASAKKPAAPRYPAPNKSHGWKKQKRSKRANKKLSPKPKFGKIKR